MRRYKNLILVLLFTFFSLSSVLVNAQCETPIVGCPGTNLKNFGLQSDNNAATIEYDNFVSSFHSTAVRTSDGTFKVWGEQMANNGSSHIYSPYDLNSTNYSNLTGTVLKVSLGSNYASNVQGVILTTNGLFVWGTQGIVVASSLTTSSTLQPITVGGNTQGLPIGVVPADVKMMFVTHQTIAITTCEGYVYVLSQGGNINQGGNSTTWTQVRTNEAGEPFLSDVIVTRGSFGGLVSLKSDGTLWTWGESTFLGNGAAGSSRNRAAEMETPAGITIKMIGASYEGTGSGQFSSYYILATNGNLYSLGYNSVRQLGDFTTTTRTNWVRPRYTNSSGPFMDNIAWFSSQEHERRYASVNAITTDGNLFSWGNNNGSMIGRTGGSVDPGVPAGPISSGNVFAVETGGHTTMITLECEENFGYVGHRTNGSMGSGATNTATETQYTFSTASVQICGAETIPVIAEISVDGNSDGTYCVDSTVTLIPDIVGGTFTYVSGPGSVVPSGDEAVVTFTGIGTVVVEYEIILDCGLSVSVSIELVSVDCVADLSITKIVDTANPNVGENVIFTIEVTNNGPYNATNVEVLDQLPSGYTYVSNTASAGTYSNTTGIWNGFDLANGDTETLQIEVTVNQTGTYLNEASVSADQDDPDTTNNEDEEAVLPIFNPELTLLKDGVYADTNGDSVVNVGDTITYTFTVENTGNVTITGVTIDDATLGITGLSVTPSDLDPGDTGTASYVYSITQADINNGGVYNIALAGGEDPNGDPVEDESEDPTPLDPGDPNYDPGCPTCTFTELPQSPELTLLKDGVYADTNGDSVVNVGDTITYTFTVENTGNVTITGVTIDDATLGITGLSVTPSDLDPGDTGTASYVYSITQADINNGGVYNIALAGGEDPNGDPVEDESEDPTPLDPGDPNYDPGCPTCTFTELPQSPELTLLKDGVYADTNGDSVVNVGDTITYTFTVENTGNVTITGVTIDDATLGITGLSVTPSDLDPGDTGTASYVYSITQADINNGGVYNIALAGGEDPNGDPVEDESEDPTPLDPGDPNYDPGCPTCTFTELPQSPELTLLKDGVYADTNGDSVVNVGDTITYTFTVENTGNVTITGVTIDDATLGITGLSVTPSDLDPGDTGTASYVYSITQADINNGGVYNIALAGGEDPNGDPVEDESEDPTPLDPGDPNYDPGCPTCTFTELPQSPELTLLKDGVYADTNGDSVVNVGDTITYTFTVENTGNVTITGVTIDDATLGITGLSVTPSDLDPGDTGTASYVYSITQADINNGGVYNIALAGGEDPNGDPVEDESEDPTPLDPGDPNYDPGCPTCTFTELPQSPELTLLKDGIYADTNGDSVVNVGDTITYTFTVENTGNVTITGVTIDDATLGITGLSVTPSDLDPGDTGTASYVYSITQADINNGGVYNIALAGGEDPNGDPVEDESEDPTPLDPGDPNYDPGCPTCTFTELPQSPELTLLKDGVYADTNGDSVVNVGDTITYTFTVENTGNVTITGVTIDDATLGITGLSVTPSDLDPGDTGTASYVYSITQADINNGGVYNIALAGGEDPNGDPVEDESEDPTPLDPGDPNYDPGCPTCTFTELPQSPELTLLKDGIYADTNGDSVVNVGDTITYTFTVENTGNVTITGVTIDDATLGITGLSVTPSDLDPGDTGTASYVYSITQADINNGGVYNIALAGGEDPNGDPVEDESEDPTPLDPGDPNYDPGCPTCTFTELPQSPSIKLVKTSIFSGGGDCAEVGDSIIYTFTVINDGNVPLHDVVLSDPLFETPNPIVPIEYTEGDTNNDGLLDVGEQWIYTAHYIITQEDIDAGEVVNQAFVESLDVNGVPQSDTSGTASENDIPTSTELCRILGIALEKSAVFNDENSDTYAQVGETISYSFKVTNTGSVTLYNIMVEDPLVIIEGGPIAVLAPGESDNTTFSAVYVITQADIDAGKVVNIATVTAEDDLGTIIEDLSDDPNDPTDIDVDDNGNPDDPTVIIFLNDGISIYNGISFNDDGKNDIFRILGIENYPDNNVQIFNRWGVLVFETDKYDNKDNVFIGLSDGRVTVKKDDRLPSGTYFYVIRFFGDKVPGKNTYTGFIHLNK